MDHTHEITEVPEAARVVTMALSMITISVLAICLMIIAIYIDSFLFIFFHIIRTVNTARFKSKLWLFNFFGVIFLVVLNFVFRIAYINEKGVCVIGMKRRALVPLITFDIILNVYLTSLFLHPLRQCYSFKQGGNSSMRTLVVRTFAGSCATLLMSVVNLSVLTILDGEPGYICLCLCNLDILFTVCVLHWATAIDHQNRNTSSGSLRPSHVSALGGASNSSHDGKADDYLELDERYVAKLTTVIEANRDTLDPEMLSSHAIGIKTQHVREVEMGPFDIDSEAGNSRESQESIVKPSSL
ncbi:hypothetical protein E4T44_09236 [Aureobasidium sp. EXF-8845]|nr:hypothetical protein E4T44_09236 [Aureobasidium sp. EXF-8845]KAI4843543.1 hypothetical protein E4T45_08566 [Aureobasidium sp. EXF-8846]